MTTALVLVTLAWFGVASILGLRLRLAVASVSRFVSAGEGEGSVGAGVREVLIDYVESGLAPRLDHRGWEGAPALVGEPQDEAVTVGDLVARIERLSPAVALADHEERAKAAFRLAYSLELPDASVARLVDPMAAELVGVDWLGKRVGGVGRVRVGELVDSATMWTLSSGTRVRVPLGWVILGEDGSVLSRAKVYCA